MIIHGNKNDRQSRDSILFLFENAAHAGICFADKGIYQRKYKLLPRHLLARQRLMVA